MWTGASADFTAKCNDGITPQNVILAFDRLFFSGNDGDFTESGVIFNDYFCTADDLTFGEAPSATVSFSVFSDNGSLASFQYGDAQAYFGVQTSTTSFSMPSGDNCYISYGGHTYEGKDTGLYIDGTLSADISVPVTGLLLVDDLLYVIGYGDSIVRDIAQNTVSAYAPNRFIVQKFSNGKSAVFDGSTAIVWKADTKEEWEYIPMGKYQVKKPSQNLADIVKITDAHDYMTLFDADATEFLDSISYPTTIGDIYEDLCDFVGVSYATPVNFTGSDVSLSESPFPETSTTLRQILKWIAEKAYCVAHFDREGVLELRWLSGSVVEEITADNVVWNSADIAEYITSRVTNAILKDTSGMTVTFDSGDNPYVIAGNPFINTLTYPDLTTLRNLATYMPITCNIIYPDPAVDTGDIVSIKTDPASTHMLTDAYGRAYANEDQKAFSESVNPYVIPLMERTLTWVGWLSGKYVARGNRSRVYDLDNAEYNASVSIAEKVDKILTPEEVFNKLTNNGEVQGLYMIDGQIYVNAEYIKSGKISAIDIEGVSITGSTLAAGRIITLDPADYSQADIDAITDIMRGDAIPSAEDWEHLDVNKDGAIDIVDINYIVRLLNTGSNIVIDARAKFDGDALTSEIMRVGYTKIGYQSVQSESLVALNNVQAQGQVSGGTGVFGEQGADYAQLGLSTSTITATNYIYLSAGGHTLSIDSTGVRVDGSPI